LRYLRAAIPGASFMLAKPFSLADFAAAVRHTLDGGSHVMMVSRSSSILDDERQIAELIGSIGSRAGFTPVVTTETCHVLTKALEACEPEVIVLDLQMPDS
jgi:PleD family two-component response regulator